MSRVKLRKFCMLIGYCGHEYYGMQRNPGFDTIEQRLLKALLDCELINQQAYLNPREIFFQRAARTDRRVSAMKQVVSLKLPETVKEKLVELNCKLPNNIRVFDMIRTIPSFDSKNFCDARTYNYLMPSFAFMPKEVPIDKLFRMSGELNEKVNQVLQHYVGTHKFHNFTSGKTIKDKNATRVIRQLSCSQPFFPLQKDKQEVEFVLIRIKGQSFVLHQIRKMIGMAIAVIRGYMTEDAIHLALTEERMNIPRAPGINLMLEETHYDTYNRKHAYNGPHQALVWNKSSEEINKFKEDFIYPVIVNGECKQDSMVEWLTADLDYHYSQEADDKRKIREKEELEAKFLKEEDAPNAESNPQAEIKAET